MLARARWQCEVTEDFRFYRLIDVIRQIFGNKGELRPEAVFPRLAALEMLDGGEEDAEATFNAFRAMLGSGAGLAHGGRK